MSEEVRGATNLLILLHLEIGEAECILVLRPLLVHTRQIGTDKLVLLNTNNHLVKKGYREQKAAYS